MALLRGLRTSSALPLPLPPRACTRLIPLPTAGSWLLARGPDLRAYSSDPFIDVLQCVLLVVDATDLVGRPSNGHGAKCVLIARRWMSVARSNSGFSTTQMNRHTAKGVLDSILEHVPNVEGCL